MCLTQKFISMYHREHTEFGICPILLHGTRLFSTNLTELFWKFFWKFTQIILSSQTNVISSMGKPIIATWMSGYFSNSAGASGLGVVHESWGTKLK